ncbi:MAG: TraB/GumN family protein [Parvularculaceae bacterium]|nr:TraB/GumN family protein [Parvularculaceae bacterium]
MKKIAITAPMLLLVCATALSSCNQVEAEQNNAPAEGPAMWRLSDEDSQIYLFGTVHILPADKTWSTPAFEQAMAETSVTMTEADVASPQAQASLATLIQQYGYNAPGVTLSQTLGDARSGQLANIAAAYGVPVSSLEPLRPWLALVMLTNVAAQKAGLDSSTGAEAIVLERARQENDEVNYLESAEFQIRALASLDEEEMLANFDATIEEFNDFNAYVEKLVRAWTSGDVKLLADEITTPLRLESPNAFETLFISRNRTWVAQIEDLLAGEDDIFIAVGAGHLVGDDSVIDQLMNAGYKVERVQ